jgi:hypothetical protein
MSLFKHDPVPVKPEPPKPPTIIPATLDPIPVIPPLVPVKPNEMDPIIGSPIGIKDCDRQIIGSVVDPTISAATGFAPPKTYVEPHTIDPIMLDPHAVNPTVIPNITGGLVSINPTLTADTVNPYVTNPIVIRLRNDTTAAPTGGPFITTGRPE